jgi:hypothetical protein
MARIKWTNVALDVRRMARELVEDPEYLAALHRRLADGKATRMKRLLLQWADTKSRDPYELRRGKPPLTVVTKYLPGDPAAHDPMREKTQRMIEAKEREEEEARAQQAAPDKQAAAAPEETMDLEVVRLPEPDAPPEPHYRSR